jgi:outer membrane protein
MKRLILILAALVAGIGAAAAQNYMVVDSEKVFRSIDAYNTAQKEIETESTNYQKQIDDAFNDLETSFNTYQERKASMSAAERSATEQKIIDREAEITKFQQQVFGEDGVIMKKRLSLIKPIQDRVFAAIEKYAKEQGFDIVLDIASNPTILYYKPEVNRTDALIAIVK